MKPQVHKVREDGLDQGLHKGFTLLELIVASAIVAMTAIWSIPEYRRGIAQAQVDRYTKNVESGLFSFRAKMGAFKESCTIDFSNVSSFQTGQFKEASIMLEQQVISGEKQIIRSTSDPLYECNYSNDDLNDMEADSPEVSNLGEARQRVQEVAASVRLVGQLNSKERDQVKVASTAQTYTFTPPGTSVNANSMTLLIQSKEANQPWAEKSDGTSRLVTRCIKAGGNGQVFSGTWTGNLCQSN